MGIINTKFLGITLKMLWTRDMCPNKPIGHITLSWSINGHEDIEPSSLIFMVIAPKVKTERLVNIIMAGNTICFIKLFFVVSHDITEYYDNFEQSSRACLLFFINYSSVFENMKRVILFRYGKYGRSFKNI